MEEFSYYAWEKIKKKFEEGLGKNRVSEKDLDIVLKFDVSNQEQFNQFDFVGSTLAKWKVHYDLEIDRKANSDFAIVTADAPNIVRIAIPKPVEKHAIAHAAQEIADHFPLMHEISEMTGVEWKPDPRSPYGKVLIPQLSGGIDTNTRKTQEMGMGFALFPGNSAPIVQDWITHQENVEKKHDLPPTSAVPDDWVTRHNVERARKGGMDKTLKPVFSR